jgi:hypothetical protein
MWRLVVWNIRRALPFQPSCQQTRDMRCGPWGFASTELIFLCVVRRDHVRYQKSKTSAPVSPAQLPEKADLTLAGSCQRDSHPPSSKARSRFFTRPCLRLTVSPCAPPSTSVAQQTTKHTV